MKRAAIIVEGYDSNKIVFWVLGKPLEIGRISIELGEGYEIIIFEVPCTKENKYKMKQRRIIEKFCGENNIQSILYADDKDENLENSWCAVKILCVLREIEAITGEVVSGKSYCIVSSSLNRPLIEAISEEASSIMLLKKGLDEVEMEELYKKVMTDKGLSIAYVDDIRLLIGSSRILLWDSPTEVVPIHIRLDKVLVSAVPMHNMHPEDMLIKYQDQIGKAVIKLANKLNLLETIPYFPYIYFRDIQGNVMSKQQICITLAKGNKTLTIQKC